MMHPSFHFRPVLLLHRNQPTDLQNKSMGWFLHNCNSGPKQTYPSQHLFGISFSFPYSVQPSQTYFTITKHKGCKLRNYLTIAPNNFMIIRILIKSNFAPFFFTEIQ